MNQISRQCGQPFVLIPGEAVFDSNVLTLDKACVFQTLTERGEVLWGVAGRPGGEEPDHWHRLGLPRPRRQQIAITSVFLTYAVLAAIFAIIFFCYCRWDKKARGFSG